MKAFLQYRPSTALVQSHLIATGDKIPSVSIETGPHSYNITTTAIEVNLAELTEAQRAVVVAAGEIRHESLLAALPGLARISSTSGLPSVWFDGAMRHQFDAIPTVAEWVTAVEKELQAAAALVVEELAAQREWYESKVVKLAVDMAKATKSWPTSIWPIENKDLTTLRNAGIDTSDHDTLMEIWHRETLPAINRKEAEYKEQEAERREQEKARKEAEKAQAEADKLAWCAEHGSAHLAQAVAAGYNCARMYTVERAAKEYPGFTVDFDENIDWKDRSCPSPKALALAIKHGGEVVWLTSPAKATDNNEEYFDDDFEPVEAVIVFNFLARYRLICE